MNQQRRAATAKGKKRRGGPCCRPRSSELQVSAIYGSSNYPQAPLPGWMREAEGLTKEHVRARREIHRQAFEWLSNCHRSGMVRRCRFSCSGFEPFQARR